MEKTIRSNPRSVIGAKYDRSKRYAIKLFYDDSRQHKFEDGLVINEEVLKSFRERNSYSEKNEKCRRIKQLVKEDKKYSIASIIESLKDSNFSKNELEILVQEILKASSVDVTVRDRYNHERGASEGILEIHYEASLV